MVTGDEVLRGRIRERNAGLLARSLEAAGVAVERVEILGDDIDALVPAIRSALDGGVDLLCTTGGLGPTHDDLTMEAVAAATGRPLALDAAALAMVEALSLPLAGDPEVARAVREKQASLPAGATVLPPVGTAPGAALEHGGTVVVVLPGPPWELDAMWQAARAAPPVAPLLARGGGTVERVLRVHAIPESRAVAALRRLDRDAWGLLGVGICARD
ncbi:MAG TPA: molybdopterin-binding protein, partial [Miltoncostaeaceae bacterium]|nr:molybdopterin-binding protein [Miltoncostaeaceae bacterium]